MSQVMSKLGNGYKIARQALYVEGLCAPRFEYDAQNRAVRERLAKVLRLGDEGAMSRQLARDGGDDSHCIGT